MDAGDWGGEHSGREACPLLTHTAHQLRAVVVVVWAQCAPGARYW